MGGPDRWMISTLGRALLTRVEEGAETDSV
jgi:hypothetical protein